MTLSPGARNLKKQMLAIRRRAFVCILILFAVAVAFFIYGLSIVQYPKNLAVLEDIFDFRMDISESLGILIDHMRGKTDTFDYESWFKHYVVVDINAPRMCGALLVGAVLAVCGAIMQAVIKNPLADPYTTGISSGALLGVSIYFAYGFTIVPLMSGNVAIILNAFFFSLVPTFIIIVFTILKKGLSPTMIILIGLGVMYMFSAISSFIRYSSDPDIGAEIFGWTLGTLSRIDWDNIYLVILALVITVAFSTFFLKNFNALSGGDNLAITLGINVRLFRIVCLVFVALVVSIIVAFVGTLGFIGLVCPHLVRIVVGANNKYVVPISAVCGSVLLLFSSMICLIITDSSLPLGAVTALIGAPLFMYLLVKQKNSSW